MTPRKPIAQFIKSDRNKAREYQRRRRQAAPGQEGNLQESTLPSPQGSWLPPRLKE